MTQPPAPGTDRHGKLDGALQLKAFNLSQFRVGLNGGKLIIIVKTAAGGLLCIERRSHIAQKRQSRMTENSTFSRREFEDFARQMPKLCSLNCAASLPEPI